MKGFSASTLAMSWTATRASFGSAAAVVKSIGPHMARQRVTVVIALMAVLSSAGTAAAVSYLVLGKVNTASATTTLKSGVNGAVLQLTNTNTSGGVNVRGLGITVPAGRAPLTVSPGAGKATNLNADMLDGIDSAALARGTNVTVLSNRLVLDNGETNVVLMTLPGLGVLQASCEQGSEFTAVWWKNTSAGVVDMWANSYSDGHFRAFLVPANGPLFPVAFWDTTTPGSFHQKGDTLILGQGNDPGPRRTATVTLAAFRSNDGAPCGLQATATVWSMP